MSRIGKQTIVIPENTKVTRDGGLFTIEGPKGKLLKQFRDEIDISIEGEEINLKPRRNDAFSRALWGTYASHLKNMIQGVNTPYEKKLIVEGVGFKSEVSGNNLVLALGFSHEVRVVIPDGLIVSAEKNVITVGGIDKELVGGFAAKVRALKKPEPYKGKGIHYEGEVIRRKAGKKAGGAEG